jgi:hypothetical protein
MKTVIVSGWKPGFQKVKFTELLRAELGFSLSKAKAATDDVLDNHHVELHVPETECDRLGPRLSELGAIFLLLEEHPGRKDASSKFELTKS